MITYNNLIFYFINKNEKFLFNIDDDDEDDAYDDEDDADQDEDDDYEDEDDDYDDDYDDCDEDDYNEFNIRPVPSYYEEDDEIEED